MPETSNVTTSVPLQMPPPYPTRVTEYEFDPIQNEVIGSLGSSMGFVAIVSIVVGVIEGLVAAYQIAEVSVGTGIITGCQSVMTLIVSIWLYGASRAFKAVVTTEGNDITNMMDALRKLRAVYKLYAVVMAIGLVLLGIGVLLILIAAGHHAH